MSSANSESFFLSFFSFSSLFLFFFLLPTWIPFISFSSLSVVARTPKSMLEGCGESGHPCLVPDFRGNAFYFSSLKILFDVVFSYMAFTMLRYVPFIPAFWGVFRSRFWMWSKVFSASIEIIIWILTFQFNMVCHIDWLICKYWRILASMAWSQHTYKVMMYDFFNILYYVYQ